MATKRSNAASDVDRQLKRYRSMRDFGITAEPSGGRESHPPQLPFVVQKHSASRLHYDFRLGWNGVLKSWAVAKGPSLNPADKRLAVEVEDHPIEYGGFEGTIPKGQYGGGTVMVWDQGEWVPQGDAEAGFRQGHIKFELRGTKLKGSWALVRMNLRGKRPAKPNWLLIKERDRSARSGKTAAITERAQRSAITGRSIEQIAASNDHVWNSNRFGGREQPAPKASFKGLREDKPAEEVRREGPQRATTHARAGSIRSRRISLEGRGHRVSTDRKEDVSWHAGEVTMPAITHPEKIVDKASGLTKEQLARYFQSVAEHMLPHVADRPLSVVRCPEGSERPCFFQKHSGQGMPDGVKSVAIKNRKTGAKEDFLTVDSAEGLVGLAQMGVLEIHPWGSRNDSLETPDRIIIDLDPDPAVEWRTLADAAREIRKRLSGKGLKSFLKTTGGKGLHVVAPIAPRHEWKVVKDFAHQLVLQVESENPTGHITKMAKASRKGKIFLDYLRNDRGATAVAPFSPRARKGAPVALPLQWESLKDKALEQFRVAEFARWRQRLKNDPWSGMSRVEQSLTAAALKQPGTKR